MYKNMSNNYAPDLSFVQQYDKEMAKFGAVRNATVRSINKWVALGSEQLSLYEDVERMRQNYDADAPLMNDMVLARENFTREQMESGQLPAYMDDMIYDESSIVQEDYDANIESTRESFFDAAYHVDDVLTSATRQGLGADYAEYREQRMAEEKEARMAELKETQNGMKSTFFNKETGESYLSLVGPDGEEDPYAFDEFN